MRVILFLFFLAAAYLLPAQPPMQKDFVSFQKSFRRVDDAFLKNEEVLKAEFAAKGLEWPAKYMYIRSFKLDSKLEIWVKNAQGERFKKFKTYKVCALAGNLGPKRYQGDYQVPEGFYYINEFKPNSQYHLALGVNYPNASDRVLSDKNKPGGEIFVHGSCVTVGCIPLTDPIIEEVYVLAASTKAAGQDFIPIHVFPIWFKSDKSKENLDKYIDNHPEYAPLAKKLEKVFYYFEVNKQIPNILIDSAGNYEMLQDFEIPKRPVPPPPPPLPPVFKENSVARKSAKQVQAFTEEALKVYITRHPEFPGGNEAFRAFTETLGNELTPFMPPGKMRAFIQVEFVVGSDGNVYNVQVDKAANNEMNNVIIERFEALKNWQPALGQKEKPVPRKLVQTIIVNAKPEEPPKPKPKVEEIEEE